MNRREFVGLAVGASTGLGALAGEGPSLEDIRAVRQRVDAGFQFLAGRMDVFQKSFVIYDDMDSGGFQFFPSGWMGDLIGLPPKKAAQIIDDDCTTTPFAGTTCIQLTYPEELAARGPLGWIGIYWTYP